MTGPAAHGVALRLHWSPDSANLVVRIALEELGLPFEAVRVDRARGAHKAPAYLALNPQGLIPVLEDGELVLFETGAILMHLADRTGRLGPGGPAAGAPVARAAFLKWLFYLSNTLHADLRAAFYSPRYVAGEAAVPALRAGLARRIAGHCGLLEGQLSAAGWLAGEGPTLVDIYLAVCLRWARLYPTGAPVLGTFGFARLSALLAALEARPALARACAAEHIPGRPLTAPEPPALPAAAVTG
ncbi:MAG TPA: glutathione S-transferase family protein [Thermohalobaculum sp.]|nr:glutathione S-transferase family protein [Thermohalobaculum sp.]